MPQYRFVLPNKSAACAQFFGDIFSCIDEAIMVLLFAAVAAYAAAISEAATPYVIASGAHGPAWSGIGHLSAGSSTRLLFSYPEPQLTDILDFLFLPSFGLSTQMLKVEIGGDGQSSDGVEPSHMRTADDLDYARGYEWRLMVEARRRNPSIQLGALAWAWPGWLDAPAHRSPWTNINLSVNYTLTWIQGLARYNLTLDFIGARPVASS